MKLIHDDPRTRKHLMTNPEVKTLVIAGVFLHDRGSLLQKSLQGVLQAILYQILSHFKALIPIAIPVSAENEARFKTQTQQLRWTHQELQRALMNLVNQSQVIGHVCLFIDALDEYDGSHFDFVDLIKKVAASAKLKIKFCVSSRPLNVFKDGFEGCLGFQIHDWTAADMSTYVTTRLRRVARLRPSFCANEDSLTDVENLRREVVRRASGVFLWVELVVDDLLLGLTNGDNMLELQERLAALPDDLEGLYRRILDSIESNYLPDTFRYFDIVRCASAPPTLLQFALAVEPPDRAISCPLGEMEPFEVLHLCDQMERRLRGRCKCLLELQGKDGPQGTLETGHDRPADPSATVQFLHQTVKDFFKNDDNARRGSEASHPEITQNPYISLMSATLHELKSLPRDSRLPSRKMDWDPWQCKLRSLLEYAKAAESGTGEPQTEILDEVERAETELWSSIKRAPRDPREHWSEPPWPTEFGSPFATSFLLLAVGAGLVLYVREKIRTQNIQLNSQFGEQMMLCAVDRLSPFELDPDMIKLLLDFGASPSQTCHGVTVWTEFLNNFYPLPPRDFLRIMQLFLDYGANPNGDEGTDPPLHLVITEYSDLTNPEVATLLRTFMERGADIGAKDHMGKSVLETAQETSGALATFLLENRPKQALSTTIVPRRRTKWIVSVFRYSCFG